MILPDLPSCSGGNCQHGAIASMGIINSREHLDSLFEAKERKVASIQDYMNKENGVQIKEADKA
ncbi:MAG: hypothetical protein OXC05_01565 [Halieaceae bacterium]|nr:hypothetical protein [Halieaceae bacterium]